MSKHTPGPWEANHETGEIMSEGPVIIGTVYGAEDFHCGEDDIVIECHANARLIAAAPELLESLIEMRAVTASIMCLLVETKNTKLIERLPKKFEAFGKRAGDVIAKATGPPVPQHPSSVSDQHERK